MYYGETSHTVIVNNHNLWVRHKLKAIYMQYIKKPFSFSISDERLKEVKKGS